MEHNAPVTITRRDKLEFLHCNQDVTRQPGMLYKYISVTFNESIRIRLEAVHTEREVAVINNEMQ